MSARQQDHVRAILVSTSSDIHKATKVTRKRLYNSILTITTFFLMLLLGCSPDITKKGKGQDKKYYETGELKRERFSAFFIQTWVEYYKNGNMKSVCSIDRGGFLKKPEIVEIILYDPNGLRICSFSGFRKNMLGGLTVKKVLPERGLSKEQCMDLLGKWLSKQEEEGVGLEF